MVVILCYARWSTEWLTGQARVELGHLPFPARLLPLLISDLPLSSLVTEDFDLAVGTVDGLVAAVVVAVGVDLQVQRKTLHALLRGEVRTQAIDRDKNLWRENKWRKLDNVYWGLKPKVSIVQHWRLCAANASFTVLCCPLLVEYENLRLSAVVMFLCSPGACVENRKSLCQQTHYSNRAFGTTISSRPWGKSIMDVLNVVKRQNKRNCG